MNRISGYIPGKMVFFLMQAGRGGAGGGGSVGVVCLFVVVCVGGGGAGLCLRAYLLGWCCQVGAGWWGRLSVAGEWRMKRPSKVLAAAEGRWGWVGGW